MQATGERLSPLDATFLELEQADEGALMHTGGALIFDPTPAHGATPSLDQQQPRATAGDGLRLPGWLSPAIDAAQVAVGAARHPRRLVQASEAAAAMSEVIWQDEIQAAPRSTLNVPIGTTRRFASVTLDLNGAKKIKQALGGTVNDVILAVATGALRRLLEQRGEKLDRPLRAMVPVNLRGEDHTSLGNQVTSLFVELPIAQPDRRRRYEQTRDGATALKSGTQALGTSTVLLVAGLAPPLLHESIATVLYGSRLFNITITNVPGPQIPLYALGARLRQILPLVPLAADHALGIAIVSYNGKLFFGVNADHAATPDLDVFNRALRDEFRALLSLAAG